ncbi:MAG: competence/damage-inducible protein A [Bacteroidales bacterium]|jgi:nicotinamide-nucleotide amidase|nr:competence/damage-inducible protein A [Bacteroidales bacterium]NPV36040.1 competence/damage-inducible protein A [Bacteroidales bacterium]
MKASIVTIGDEILIGQIINTNSAWIALRLNSIGIKVHRMLSIGDSREEIIRCLDQEFASVDLIITTGGLGPTSDDITKQTLTEYFGTHLVFNSEAYKDVEAFFTARGLPLTEANRQQAMLPENALSLPNPEGTARGMWFTDGNRQLISLPGVPFEMEVIMENEVLPRLERMYASGALVHRTVMTAGIGESFLADKIAEWEKNLPPHFKLAYLPSPGVVRLRLSASGYDAAALNAEVNNLVEELQKIIPEYIFSLEDEPLPKAIGRMLLARKATLCTAESCTGGYIAHLITTIPGSSQYYKGSVVSYANEIKENLLGVSNNLLHEYGAVSRPVVEAMAAGARNLLKTDYAIAVSGIAGPDGGTVEKPVGLTWIAIAGPEGIVSTEFRLGNRRERNIQRAAVAALNELRKIIQ